MGKVQKQRQQEYLDRLKQLKDEHLRTIDEHTKRTRGRLQQAAKKLVADCEAKQQAVQEEISELHTNVQELKATASRVQKLEKIELTALAQAFEAKANELTSDALRQLSWLKDDHAQAENGVASGTMSDLEEESDGEAA